MKYQVGIIDDDESKITQLLTFIKLALNDEEGNLIKEKYRNIELEPFKIPLEKTVEKMVDAVCNLKPHALVVDFKLSSQKNISYSGIEIAQAIDKKLRGFPLFMLTSYQDDLYVQECFDVYQVFDFERYINDEKERVEINSKIIEQIKKYNATLQMWQEELKQLISEVGKTAEIDERIIELDSLLENSIDGNSALTPKIKRELGAANRIQELIEKIDILIKR